MSEVTLSLSLDTEGRQTEGMSELQASVHGELGFEAEDGNS